MFTIVELQEARDRGIYLYKFIASVLGMEANTVRSRVHRGTPFTDEEVEKIESAWSEVFPGWGTSPLQFVHELGED